MINMGTVVFESIPPSCHKVSLLHQMCINPSTQMNHQPPEGFVSWLMKETWIRRPLLSSTLTSVSPPSPGWLCVWNVGPCGHRHYRGLANRRCPLQYQDDSPQEEEQLQTPEEEGQTARGQYPSPTNHLFVTIWPLILGLRCVKFISVPQQPREPGTSRQDQAMLLADSSEDEFWWDCFGCVGWCSSNGGLANITIAMTKASPITLGCLAVTHLIHRVWLSIGHNLHRLHKGQLCIPPPFLKIPV